MRNKKTWRTALAFGLPWTIFMIIFRSIVIGGPTVSMVISTMIGGILAGVAFALIMNYTAKKLYKKTIVDIPPTETIIKEGGANHFKGKEGVGGKLVLTDKQLIFKSHNYNIKNHQDSFDLPQIGGMDATKTLNFITNGLSINLTSGELHKFIVDEPADWIASIDGQKNNFREVLPVNDART